MKKTFTYKFCCRSLFCNLLFLLLLVQSNSSMATIRYVKQNGAGNASGTSWANASADIQAMVNASAANDEVWVAGGKYVPNRRLDAPTTITPNDRNNSFVLKKDVKMYGGFAGTETTLTSRNLTVSANTSYLSGDFNGDDGANFVNNSENAYHVIYGNGDVGSASVDGFTITGGNANSTDAIGGGGIYLYCSPSFSNVTIINNSADFYGGGIYNSSSYSVKPKFTNCSIIRNKSKLGGGMLNDGYGATLTNVLIAENIATLDPENLNFSGYGGGVYSYGTIITCTNCTIANNIGLGVGAGIYNTSRADTLHNSIVYGNYNMLDSSLSNLYSGFNSSLVSTYNSLIQGLTTSDNGNIDGSTNPVFVYLPTLGNYNGDYRLQACSPVINQGSNSFFAAGQSPNLTSVTTDLAQNPRIAFGTVDLGAYEFQGTIATIRYVKAGATGNGCSWDDASGDLQSVINSSPSGSQIWVAGGTYKPNRPADNFYKIDSNNRNNAFVLKSGVKIYGGFAGTETTLAARNLLINRSILSDDFNGDDSTTFVKNTENAYHIIIGAGSLGSAVLDGFSIVGGNANGNNSVAVNGQTITQSTGGGITLNGSSPMLTNLIISGNNASNYGGGMANYSSSPIITNAVITNNKAASLIAFGGGGIFNLSSFPILTSVTISGNTAPVGGAISNSSSTPTIRVGIIYGNNTGISNDNTSSVSFFSSLIQGLTTAANGNLDGGTDPLFVNPLPIGLGIGGDYRLLPCSPAIDKPGVNYFSSSLTPNLSSITTDVIGNPRISGVSLDVGAYEYVAGTVPSTMYVTAGGTGNGCTWATASGDLQAAINASVAGGQIWVAKGTYIPTHNAVAVTNITPKDRNDAFVLKSGVKIYGGFAGNETSLAARTLDPTNPSILSGDFNGDDGANFSLNTENAYHVVIAANVTGGAVLDGFTITGGNANGQYSSPVNTLSIPQNTGGGITIYSSSVKLNYINANNNSAVNGGGFNLNASPITISNSIINQDSAVANGGGMYVYDSKPNMVNVLITNNAAGNAGGAMYNIKNAACAITNATIANNRALISAGGLSNLQSSPLIRNSIIATNSSGITNDNFSSPTIAYSLVQGNTSTANGNLSGYTDPLFVTNGSDFRLQQCSPAVNTGNSDYFGSGQLFDLSNFTTDVVGNTRLFGTIDMGAYEYQQSALTKLADSGDRDTTTIQTLIAIPLKASTSGCKVIATILPQGQSPVSGVVTAKNWIESNLIYANTTPLVQRHYEITAAENASTATAFVTLYFSQNEFNAFNNIRDLGNANKLPTFSNDAAGKARLRIIQYHGNSSDGSGLPASYPNKPIVIDPDDSNIVYNTALVRWEISFAVTGFSGFFVSNTASTILPVSLISFTGQLNMDKTILLQWQVAEQVDIKNYLIEKSTDGNNFVEIGSTLANNLSNTNYTFTDASAFNSNIFYYRLKIIGKDGVVTYSSIITVRLQNSYWVDIYPNPANDYVVLQGQGANLVGTEAIIFNMQGQKVLQTPIKQWPQKINVKNLTAGIYMLQLNNSKILKLVIEH